LVLTLEHSSEDENENKSLSAVKSYINVEAKTSNI